MHLSISSEVLPTLVHIPGMRGFQYNGMGVGEGAHMYTRSCVRDPTLTFAPYNGLSSTDKEGALCSSKWICILDTEKLRRFHHKVNLPLLEP